MKTRWILAFLILAATNAKAQWMDDFSDGDFLSNPPWSGNTTEWIVNAAGQLQSSSQTPNSSFYLATPSAAAANTEWELYVHLGFNTSSTNYIDVFAIASAPDLTAAATSGYFVRIGNTQDEVSLYRKDASGITRLIDGADGTTNVSDNFLRIRLVRAGNTFTLYRDATGTGNAYVLEGTSNDGTYTASAYFGLLVHQSTAAFFGRHSFDDIHVRPYVPDTSPPALIRTATATASANALDLYFSKTLDLASAQTPANFSIDGGIGMPATVQRDATDGSLVHAAFSTAFLPATDYRITVQHLRDLSGNVLDQQTVLFRFYRLRPYDVLIDEIMADPSPPVGLPSTEYLELRNCSGHPIDLAGWHLATQNATSAAFPRYALPADSFVVLVGSSQLAAWSGYRNVLGIGGFPSLDNDAGVLSLTSAEGMTIHGVAYNSSEYESPVKKQGGWSLELIDPHNPCARGNWKQSEAGSGGTPGRPNSVAGAHPDPAPPQLLRAYLKDSLTLVCLFDKPLDSASAAQIAHYRAEGLSFISAKPVAPLFSSIALGLSAPMTGQRVYEISVTGLTDCADHALEQAHTRAGRPEAASAMDLVINELLFDPPPSVSDFVELYNRSHKILDMQGVYLTNRNSLGRLNTPQKIADTPFLLFPGEYLLVTTDAAALRRNYRTGSLVLEPPSLPSLPDDSGALLLLDGNGSPIDEVNYSAKWHFPLIANPQGVSLERADPFGVSQNRANWHSAASTAGYATPGLPNSQYFAADALAQGVEIGPQVFSPDNDGRDDVLRISYSMEEAGYVANITVFDAAGRPVRQLVRNELLGQKGLWTWDGLDALNRKLPLGAYVVYAEVFNLQGRRKAFKKAVFIAGGIQ